MKLFQSSETKHPQPAQLSRQEALRCRPVINGSIRMENSGEGDVILEYPLPLKPFFLSLFQRFQKNYEYPTKKLQLDEMGSHVWKYIDGKTSVKSMIEDFANHYGVTQQEAEQSITAFLVELGKRGIIAMR